MMELPPVIRIAIDEELSTSDSPKALKETILGNGLFNELRRQAEWSLNEHDYVDAAKRLRSLRRSNTAEFGVVASATLNPFSPAGKCFASGCMDQASEAFIKTVGLYTETAVIPDPLTTFFTSDSLDDEGFEVLFRHLKILENIRPLFEAGVLRFATPIHRYCIDCNEQVQRFVAEATDEVIAGISSYKAGVIGDRLQGFHLALELPVLQPAHNHRLLARTKLTPSQAALLANTIRTRNRKSKPGRKLLRQLMGETVKREMNSVFFELDTARRLGSLLLTGSRSEALVIGTLDKSVPKLSEIEDWERLRTINLPWLGALTCEEVLRLREEADTALPRLRELLRTQLIVASDENKEIPTVVADLRSQSLEVEAELNSLNLPKESRFRAGMAGLAMSFVVYGFATQSPHLMAASMATLLATLVHLRNTERDHDSEVATLTSKPAYALLKAKQILGDRSE